MKLMRKLIILLAVSAMLVCVGAAAEAETPVLIEQPESSEELLVPIIEPSVFAFPDISAWAQPEVFTLYSRDAVPEPIMADFSTAITRAEFTAIISCSYEKITGEIAPYEFSGFADIDTNAYYISINQAYNLGIINGRNETTFDPDSGITRQEAAKILYSFLQALEKAAPLTDSAPPFADASDIDDWAVPYVAYAYDNGLMEGTDIGFEPKGSLTREQAMAIIERMWAGIEGDNVPAPEPTDRVYRAVCVGMSDYGNADFDGERFEVSVNEYMEKLPYLEAGGKTYEASSIVNVLKDDLFAYLDSVFNRADEDDVSLIFFSGHGTKAHKIAMTNTVTDEMHDFSVIIDKISQYKGTKVIIVGNCYSGCLIPMSAHDDSIVVITACAANEESHGIVLDSDTYNMFERAVLHALHFDNGFNADYNGDGIVYAYELAAYVKFEMAHTISGAESTVHYKPGNGAVIATGIIQTEE